MDHPPYAQSRDGFKIELAAEPFWYLVSDAAGACVEISGLSRAYEVFGVGHFCDGDMHWFAPRSPQVVIP